MTGRSSLQERMFSGSESLVRPAEIQGLVYARTQNSYRGVRDAGFEFDAADEFLPDFSFS